MIAGSCGAGEVSGRAWQRGAAQRLVLGVSSSVWGCLCPAEPVVLVLLQQAPVSLGRFLEPVAVWEALRGLGLLKGRLRVSLAA